jgi:hypothetical protein
MVEQSRADRMRIIALVTIFTITIMIALLYAFWSWHPQSEHPEGFDIIDKKRVFIKTDQLADRAAFITVEKHDYPLLYIEKEKGAVGKDALWYEFYNENEEKHAIQGSQIYLFLYNLQNSYIVNEHTDAVKKYPIYQLALPNKELGIHQKRIINKKSIQHSPHGTLIRIYDENKNILVAIIVGKRYKQLRRRIHMYHMRHIEDQRTYLVAFPMVIPHFIQSEF